MTHRLTLLPLVLLFAFSTCAKKEEENSSPPKVEKGKPASPNAKKSVKPKGKGKPHPPRPLTRAQFNAIAAKLNLPLFWMQDANGNNVLDPPELATLLFYDDQGPYVVKGAFTPVFKAALKRIRLFQANPFPAGLSKTEIARRTLVMKDLDQGRPTLVYTDATKFSPEERLFMNRMYKVSRLIDQLYAIQNGTAGLEKRIPAGDTASRRLLARNLSTKCVAPATEKDSACTALPGVTPLSGVYPVSLTKGDSKRTFCKKLADLDKKIKDEKKQLLYQFNVVREEKGSYVAVPYTTAFKALTTPISAELKSAAQLLKDPKEAALKAYLLAAAQAFLDNDWYRADAKWVAMNALNSKWYLRVGPDEVYWDPCNRKAGFHFTFSRINPASIRWQKKIEPIKNDMEKALATLIGAPYKARKIGLHLPDFIDIVTNAGNDRSPL
ncbi:MAG: hypothetical protein CSA75_02315, partial [Sorangium cellulosum]